MNNNDIFEKLHNIRFSIGETITTRGADCLDNKLNIEDYTDDDCIFFTDNWLPMLLKDIPGKYVWIGFKHSRGKNIKKYLPKMRAVANQINGGLVYDYTRETDMLFVFIPEDN